MRSAPSWALCAKAEPSAGCVAGWWAGCSRYRGRATTCSGRGRGDGDVSWRADLRVWIAPSESGSRTRIEIAGRERGSLRRGSHVPALFSGSAGAGAPCHGDLGAEAHRNRAAVPGLPRAALLQRQKPGPVPKFGLSCFAHVWGKSTTFTPSLGCRRAP